MTAPKPIPSDRVDWFRVLADLRRAGLSLRKITSLVRMSKNQLIGLRNLDAEPKHAPGERLVALWMQQTSLARDALPRQSAQYSCTRTEVRAWDGGTIYCPTCGHKHDAATGAKTTSQPRLRASAAGSRSLFDGLESAPHMRTDCPGTWTHPTRSSNDGNSTTNPSSAGARRTTSPD